MQRLISMALALGLAGLAHGPARSASHSDAPLIKQDPQANITDVYAFVGDGVLNTVVHVRPFSEPGDGPHYDRFADDARYSIHLTDPTTGRTVIRYDFQFSDVNPRTTPGLQDPNTLLSYGRARTDGPIKSLQDPDRNYTQTYSVRRNNNVIGRGITTPPNVGARTTPLYNDATTGFALSGATDASQLDIYTRQAIQTLSRGERSFAGPREDGFYADVPGIFDLLDPRILDNDGDTGDGIGQDGHGVDGFKGFNVLAYALEIPLDSLNTIPGFPRVGVYASVSRRRVRLLRRNGDPQNSGPWIQVNRMGNPLFNEAFVALRDKDRYNRTAPIGDARRFAIYAEEPELARLLNAVFSTNIPETGRSDLRQIFIPDVLRVDTSTGPVPLAGQTGFNRLSVFGSDFTNGVPSGFPNGRRFGDDVVDIALTALGGSSTPIGDNVSANDQVFHQVFPYAATPHSGARNLKDSQ